MACGLECEDRLYRHPQPGASFRALLRKMKSGGEKVVFRPGHPKPNWGRRSLNTVVCGCAVMDPCTTRGCQRWAGGVHGGTNV